MIKNKIIYFLKTISEGLILINFNKNGTGML